MKKVLILTYFFPPANFAGCYRIGSWARHLNKYGVYPVVVTRSWNEHQTEISDPLQENSFKHEKHDGFEVYRLPYHRNLRDRLHAKYGDAKFKLLRKFLTVMELLLQGSFDAIIPYHNLRDFAEELILKEKDFSALIVSGRPFQLFKFANSIHRKTGIPWLADYRDEWNTHQWIVSESFRSRMISNIERRSEKKWISNARMFTTCSENWVKNISAFTGKTGEVLLNGYDEEIVRQDDTIHQEFTIVHNGTMYTSQPLELFTEAYKRFISDHPGVKVQFLMPGVIIDEDTPARIRKALSGFEQYYSMSPRIPKKDLVDILVKADVFLMIGTRGAKGHHSSKIFEYIGFRKPILLVPSDHDVMQALLDETKSGIYLNSEEELYNWLVKAYEVFLSGKKQPYAGDEAVVKNFSRESQAGKLAAILKASF
jgi:glycosyltransferase involved in cell wall biosynthesis